MSHCGKRFTRVTTFSRIRWIWLGLLLRFRYGFWRQGPRIIADTAVFPDFVRGNKIIHSGWDNWFGYHLLASNEDADEFLKVFYARHCQARDLSNEAIQRLGALGCATDEQLKFWRRIWQS